MSESIVIIGSERVEGARLLALRSALSLQLKGMKMSRGASASEIATRTVLKPAGIVAEGKRPNANTVYKLLNDYIVENLGPQFDRPLHPKATNEH